MKLVEQGRYGNVIRDAFIDEVPRAQFVRRPVGLVYHYVGLARTHKSATGWILEEKIFRSMNLRDLEWRLRRYVEYGYARDGYVEKGL